MPIRRRCKRSAEKYPEFLYLNGDVVEAVCQLSGADGGLSTNSASKFLRNGDLCHVQNRQYPPQ